MYSSCFLCFFFVFSLFCFFFFFFFFFNDTATTEIYTLSLHDALPICARRSSGSYGAMRRTSWPWRRSEEHTSELQSPMYLVCRLLLEKKKKTNLSNWVKHSVDRLDRKSGSAGMP